MWHVGIDLHRTTVVLAAVNDGGEIIDPITIPCSDAPMIVRTVGAMGTFRAVIEATGTYRWLYDLLRPHGTVLLAHPMRLRAMIQRRTKTDKLDAQLLANLLRINQIPLAYIPPEPYQQLRDLTRGRARLGRHLAEAKIQLRALLARQNRESPYRTPFGPRGLAWFSGQDFGPIEDMVRDELLERFRHYAKQMSLFDKRLEAMRQAFPQVECLCDIRGIGLYSALLIVAELGEVDRFCTAKQVGAYTGLTSRVHQSGGHCYQGSITRMGSPWLRWVFVQAAMKAVHSDEDLALKNFYQRIRKRSGAKIARVAAARKLAEICWKRLRRWQRERAGQAA
jgi:transposase